MLVFTSKQSLEITYEENKKATANKHIFATLCIIPLYNHYNIRNKMRHLYKGVKKTRRLLPPDNVAYVLILRGLRLDGELRSRRVYINRDLNVLNNRTILIDGKRIFLKEWYDKEVIFIQDFCNENGKRLSFQQFYSLNGIRTNFLRYMGIPIKNLVKFRDVYLKNKS